MLSKSVITKIWEPYQNFFPYDNDRSKIDVELLFILVYVYSSGFCTVKDLQGIQTNYSVNSLNDKPENST